MSEAQIQHRIVQAIQALGHVVFSVPNEAAGNNQRRQMHMVSMGLRSGVSDLVVVSYKRVVFLEVKTPKGSQSDKQARFQREVEARGHEYYIVRSVEDVLRVFDPLTQ